MTGSPEAMRRRWHELAGLPKPDLVALCEKQMARLDRAKVHGMSSPWHLKREELANAIVRFEDE